jgi:hypothetical protein
MSGPVTYHEAGGDSIVDQEKRFRQLAEHDALAGAIAIGKARGTYVPSEYVNEQRYPPLTLNEHLEMLALGENLARYYRHPAQVDKAVKAGGQLGSDRGYNRDHGRGGPGRLPRVVGGPAPAACGHRQVRPGRRRVHRGAQGGRRAGSGCRDRGRSRGHPAHPGHPRRAGQVRLGDQRLSVRPRGHRAHRGRGQP